MEMPCPGLLAKPVCPRLSMPSLKLMFGKAAAWVAFTKDAGKPRLETLNPFEYGVVVLLVRSNPKRKAAAMRGLKT